MIMRLLKTLTLIAFLSLSCVSQTHVIHKRNPANSKAFAFIVTEVKGLMNCKDKNDKNSCEKFDKVVTGSGSFVLKSKLENASYVLTAGHVCSYEPYNAVSVERTLTVVDFYGNESVASASIVAEEFDACILLVTGTDERVEFNDVANDMPEVGDLVYSMAAPGGFFIPGVVLLFDGYYSGALEQNSCFTIPATYGSSGGPVLNSDGQVIGIIEAIPSVYGNRIIDSILLAVKLSNIQRMIKDVKEFDEMFNMNN